jgi:hypothetical protein
MDSKVPLKKLNKTKALRIEGEKIFWFGKELELAHAPRNIFKLLIEYQGQSVTYGALWDAANINHTSKISPHLTAIRRAIENTYLKNNKKTAKNITRSMFYCPRKKGVVTLKLPSKQKGK